MFLAVHLNSFREVEAYVKHSVRAFEFSWIGR